MADLTAKAKKIKMIGTDIDGVWTNAQMYVTPEGEWMRNDHTLDAEALDRVAEALMEAGVPLLEQSH